MAPSPSLAASMNSGVTPIEPHDTTRSRATCSRSPRTSITPTLFVGMLEVPGYREQVARLRVVSGGSMGVTPEFIDAAREGLGAMVKRTYGSTEAPTITTSSWQDGMDKARD